MADDLLPLMGINPGGDDSESESEHEDEEEDDIEASPQLPNITYERSLPGAHSYLGEDFEDVRGRTIHEDDTYLTLPIMTLPGVVLVPGQTLPLQLFQPSTVAMIRHVVDGDNTFGMVTSRYSGDGGGPVLASIGTTAEIYSIRTEHEERMGITTVRVKATGRQRFEIKESRRQADGIVVAKVRIIPERILSDPLEGARPPSHLRLCHNSDNDASVEESLPQQQAVDRHGDMFDFPAVPVMHSRKRKQHDRYSSAHLTWWPPWVYKQYDVHCLIRRIKKELHSWNETLSPEKMPADPSDFSFWLAGNLPLDDTLKLHLLQIDSAVQRLRCELSIMQRCTVLCCKDCGLLIANKRDVFSMALEGPLGAYVNPGGYVHETLTVYKAHGLNLIGRPSTEHSWFPGYAWTIVQCRHCGSHMGWKFTASKKKLQPEKFWGLTRSSVQPGLQNDEEPTDDEKWLPMM